MINDCKTKEAGKIDIIIALISSDKENIGDISSFFVTNPRERCFYVIEPGEEMEKIIGILQPDLITLDLDSAGGLQGLKKLRSITPVPIITITNNLDLKLSDKAIINGSSYHLAKPIFEEEFVSKSLSLISINQAV